MWRPAHRERACGAGSPESLRKARASDEILSVTGALLGMIPQGLVLLTSSVLAIATIRLARKNVLAQQLYCIETLARVDVLCLDKTGTITSGRMTVEGTYPLPVEGSVARDAAELLPRDVSVLDFALANVARATSADATRPARRCLISMPRARCPQGSPSAWFRSRRRRSGAELLRGGRICYGRCAVRARACGVR